MKNLSRLFVSPVVIFLALIAREHPQSVTRQLRIQKQCLVGSDQRITPEDRRKPWNTGSNNPFTVIGNLQRMEVAYSGVQYRIKNSVTAGEMGNIRLPPGIPFAPCSQAIREVSVRSVL